jgi:ABC-type sugar transport system permease subunit
MRTYAVAALLTTVVALGAFSRYRNHAFTAREEGRARAAALVAAEGGAPDGHVIAAGVVASAVPSERYAFLRLRQVAGPDGEPRRLGGPGAPPTDKLLYDAAQRAETRGAFALLDDGGARAIAAVPVAGGVAVAVVAPPAGPEGFPWLVVIGLLAMGGLCAAAGGLVGGWARPAGVALGASGLAVPAHLWAGPAPAVAVILLAVLAGVAEWRGVTGRAAAELGKNRIAYGFLAPTALAMLALVATPFVVGLVIGFYDHHHGEWTFVGLDNFRHILSGGGRPLDDPMNFWFTLGVTVVWTAANVVLHVTIGVALALALRQPWLRLRGIYRVLLVLPWAIPNYITALIWHGMFQSEYGAINGLLGLVGLDTVSWFSSWATSFTANVCANTWLGFPFMMVVALGALESIPRDLDEAAEVDGASRWQRFWHITLPHLRPALGPAVVLGAIWTFNMFNVIYLVSDGQPGGSTDILVTEAYRWAFERGERYGLAAAYATIILGILLLWTVFGTRVTRRGEGAR